ncbi:universal stress protein [Halorussus gelatinilyticus]|uniref:Universal stress protein n=1 Tax=Halorussus gelatinilyticus TaxID=2937524 RepID=A0A8U0IES6_9EURY|nr:universal stress protein [Halorussus gelatinilyticus]UPV99569.1 universal stress protein [Halorussus gelatinilyticus]
MYHVVIAVDEETDRARRQASAVADLPNAAEEVRATLLHVFTENPGGASATQVGSVRRAEELLESEGVEVDIAERSGNPAAAVLDFAESEGADCICVGGRSRSPAGKAIFGSVSQSVILQSDRPVLVTGGETE